MIETVYIVLWTGKFIKNLNENLNAVYLFETTAIHKLHFIFFNLAVCIIFTF